MKKQLRGKIEEIERSAKYRLLAHMGWDEASKSYPRKTRIFYGTKREAEAFLRDWLYELENPEEVKSTETVWECLDNWIENDSKILLKWEQNTRDRAERIIEKNIKPNIAKSKLLVDFSPDDVMKLYSDLGGENNKPKKLSPRSLRYVHTILNQALNHAVKMQKITVNPANGLTPAKSQSKDQEKWVVMTGEQLSSFLNSIKKHQDYSLIYVAAYTGARQSELLGLTWDKILWLANIIRIEQSMHTISKDEFEHRPRTKNATSTRNIKVTGRVIRVLEEHKKQQEEKGISIADDALVFTDKHGNPISRSNIGQRYSRLAGKYGFKGMTFHHLRHTHATILLSSGANINEVSERLGHKDASITLKIYGHVLPGRDQSLAKRFDTLVLESEQKVQI